MSTSLALLRGQKKKKKVLESRASARITDPPFRKSHDFEGIALGRKVARKHDPRKEFFCIGFGSGC